MSSSEVNYTSFYPMEYYEELAKTFVTMSDRLPTSTLEIMYLSVGLIMGVGIMRCMFTTGRRYFDSDRLFFKLQGWVLVLLISGQTAVAVAFLQRSLRGHMDEWVLVWGIMAWLTGRYSLQALSSVNKKIAQRKKK